MKAKLIFAWYDLWIGVFVDRHKKKLYVFLIPMVGIVISKKNDPQIEWHLENVKRLQEKYKVIHEKQKKDGRS